MLEALLDGLHVGGASLSRPSIPVFYPGRVARLRVNGESIGVLGQLHPLVQQVFDLPPLDAPGGGEQPVLAADLDFEALSRHIPASHRVSPVPRFPAVRQDLAVIVDEDTPADRVQAAILAAGGGLLAGVRLFDV